MMEEKELIETLWNVNMFQPTSCTKKRTELIETLWNVNFPVIIPIQQL